MGSDSSGSGGSGGSNDSNRISNTGNSSYYDKIYNYVTSLPKSLTRKKQEAYSTSNRYDIVLIAALLMVFLITVLYLERNSLFNFGLFEMVDEHSASNRSAYYGLVILVIIMVLVMNKLIWQ